MHILWDIYKRGCRNLHSFLCMPLARMGETIAIKYMFLIVFSWAKYVFIKTNLIKYFNNQMFWKHCRDVKRSTNQWLSNYTPGRPLKGRSGRKWIELNSTPTLLIKATTPLYVLRIRIPDRMSFQKIADNTK